MAPGVMDELRERAGRSVLLRMLFIAFLILVLQIPILTIDSTVSEREATRQGAIAEVTRTWGAAQQVAGPVLTVPYLVRSTDDKGKVTVRTAHANFLPRELDTTATVVTEVRYRGIFQVPLYSLTLNSRGTFAPPDFSVWQVAAADVLWDRAVLAVGLSDPKALRAGSAVRWGSETSDFRPGRGAGAFLEAGIHAPLPGLGAGRDRTMPFAFDLSLGGSQTLLFAPLGMETRVGMTSAWPDPSFIGAYLPTSREVGPKGFTARWQIPHLGRNFPQQWLETEVDAKAIGTAAFGVSLLSPVDTYHHHPPRGEVPASIPVSDLRRVLPLRAVLRAAHSPRTVLARGISAVPLLSAAPLAVRARGLRPCLFDCLRRGCRGYFGFCSWRYRRW